MEINEKQIFSLLQKAKETGKLKIGVNEVTKALERGQSKLVLGATDVSPAEIIAHLPGLSKEMKAGYIALANKTELGASVGIKNTSAIAILDAGSAKKELDEVLKSLTEDKKEEKVEETKDEAKTKVEEKKVEETKEEVKTKVEEEKVEEIKEEVESETEDKKEEE